MRTVLLTISINHKSEESQVARGHTILELGLNAGSFSLQSLFMFLCTKSPYPLFFPPPQFIVHFGGKVNPMRAGIFVLHCVSVPTAVAGMWQMSN